jgi:hypothetical protein
VGAMITTRINTKLLLKTLNNVIDYSQSFTSELKKNENRIATNIANASTEVFYEYLDGLARSHPGMLHHVYEWGQVGNPSARLFELTTRLTGKNSMVVADFLESDSIPSNGNQAFYDKATIMEEGIPVVINEVDAKALFFEVDGEEFFRTGPIYIANPGGAETRGSFVKAFNEFYGVYFNQVYLDSIGFYKHYSNPAQYTKNFKNALKGVNARTLGRAAALSWIANSPGGRL